MVGASVAVRPISTDICVALLAGEQQERGGEHRRDHRAADEALRGAEHHHLAQAGCAGAGEREQREAECAGDEQHAGRQQARQPARQRDHDDLGDQVAGLHPGCFVRAGGEARLDVGDRGGDDLDVQDRHEHPDHHRHEADPLRASRGDPAAVGAPLMAMTWSSVAAAAPNRPSRCASGPRVSTSAVTDRPARSQPACAASAGSSTSLTGTRCTTLVKLPVAFSGGSRLNSAPVAGARLSTRPSTAASGSMSGTSRTFMPGAHAAKLGLLEVGDDIEFVAQRCDRDELRAGVTCWPSSAARLPAMPSNGARITV